MSIAKLFAAPSQAATRREFLARARQRRGLLALASMLGPEAMAAEASLNPLAAHPGHFPGKAKSVIWLFLNGGPSQVDTWDYKPELAKQDGKDLPGFDKNTGFFTAQVGPLMKSPFRFAKHGQSGTYVSEIFPNLAKHVDDLAILYSCHTNTNNHSPALFEMNTGMSRMGFPCMGAWVTYGLGSETQDLPAFVVMYDTLGRGIPKGHAQNWGTGFLPGVFQGTALNAQGAARSTTSTRGRTGSTAEQRAQLDLVNRLAIAATSPATPTRPSSRRVIESFELAYRMQMAAPEEVLDVNQWDRRPHRELYGLDEKKFAATSPASA